MKNISGKKYISEGQGDQFPSTSCPPLSDNLPQAENISGYTSRLDRLEENAFFQDRLIAELNEGMLSQQEEISKLYNMIEQGQKRIRALEDALDGLDRPENTRPPHY